MSTLTKVFIVLLSVFSIAFTVMTVSITSQTTNWRDVAKKYEDQAVIADTHLRNLIAANAAEVATSRDAVRSAMEKIASLEGDLKSAKQESGQLKVELARAASEKSNAEAINRGLLGQLQVAEQARTEYQKQRDDLENRGIQLEQRNIDLNDRVNEQTAQISVFAEQRRQYEQQLNLLKKENENLSTGSQRVSSGRNLEAPTGTGLPGVVAKAPVADRIIRGQLTEVDGNMVTMSVGSADGVKKDMRFVIYRNETYIGDLTVSLVEPNQSAGRLVRSTATPQTGDQIIDELGLTASQG